MSKKSTTIGAIALALALALPATALADNAQETLTVTPSQTFSGVPATIAYPSVAVTLNADAPSFAIVAGTANNPAGYKVDLSLVDLAKTGDPSKTIPVSAHSINIAATFQPNTTIGSGFTAGSFINWPGTSGTAKTLFQSSQGQAVNDSVNITMRLTPGASVVPGSYTGTAVFTFSLK